jgi:hypothetical protein
LAGTRVPLHRDRKYTDDPAIGNHKMKAGSASGYLPTMGTREGSTEVEGHQSENLLPEITSLTEIGTPSSVCWSLCAEKGSSRPVTEWPDHMALRGREVQRLPWRIRSCDR